MIICKINLELNWTRNCVASSVARETKLEITQANLYLLIVIVLTGDNMKLTKKGYEWFKRSVYWNQCKTTTESKEIDNNYLLRLCQTCCFFSGSQNIICSFFW